MSEFEYNSPMFMQTVYLAVKDGVTEAIQHMQATGFIEEIAAQIKGDTTLATRLAEVERERDALREGLVEARAALEDAIPFLYKLCEAHSMGQAKVQLVNRDGTYEIFSHEDCGNACGIGGHYRHVIIDIDALLGKETQPDGQ